MSERISPALPTRAEFEKALVVAAEGREHHGLYATEDAEAILQPIAKYYWRQLTLNGIPVIAGMNLWAALHLPWYTLVIGVIGGALIMRALTFSPFLAVLFAPPGFTADDVARASSRAMRLT